MQNRYATIDLGSNSFHLLIAELEHGEIRPVYSLSERVMLAEGLDKKTGISESAMQRGMECAQRFAQLIQGIPRRQIRVVGTNTLRAAKNANATRKNLEQLLGVDIDIISGLEEARLIFLGVSQTWSAPTAANKLLVLDIGGGSTEVMLGQPFNYQNGDSLRMGCIAFRRFFGDETISHENFQRAYQAASYEIGNVLEMVTEIGWQNAVGSAGTFRAIETILQANGQCQEGISINGLYWLKKRLLKFDRFKDINLPGLKETRVPSIVPGLAIALALFEQLGIELMQVARGGLREGVLYDLLGSEGEQDIRMRSILALQKRYHAPPSHIAKMQKGLQRLLQCASFATDFSAQSLIRQRLLWATHVCQIGLAINHSKYQQHSAYLLQHSELSGFSLRERNILAQLVQNHRRKLALEDLSELAKDKTELEHLLQAIFLLRIAHLMALTQSELPEQALTLSWQSSKITLTVAKDWLAKRPMLEYGLQREADYWRKVDFEFSVSLLC